MAEIFTQIAALLSVFQFLVQVNDQSVQVTEELLRQHKEQRSQEMALILEMLQREEQRSQEMALVLEMLQRSQEEPESAQESLWLSACQHWWFWISAEMLLVLFAFYWLPRHGNSGYDGSADGETPAARKEEKEEEEAEEEEEEDAAYGDRLDDGRPADPCLVLKDTQNSEETRG